MELKTPNGYTVVLKDVKDLTFRDKRAIQKTIMASMKVSAIDPSKTELTASGIFEAQDEILKLVLKRIVDNQGQEVSGNLFDFIMDKMPEKDGDFIYEKVNKYFQKESVKN